MTVLCLNAGSTSLKLSAFRDGVRVASNQRDRLAEGGHAAALFEMLADLPRPRAAVHRIVHGGDRAEPALLDDATLTALDALAPLAPLHNPPALAAVRALTRIDPDLPQIAVFDTAFHATMPEVERALPLPEEERARGLRRYGFHGISYSGVAAALDPLPGRLLALHLGGGCSACAIVGGRSVATTMGYSPASGLPMGTRAGDLDPMAVLDLARRHGADGAAEILNRRSGLLALGGSADMRTLRAEGRGAAVEYLVHWTLRQCGALIAAMRGLDAVAFTGGIGENDASFREAVMEGLAWTGCRAAHVVPADEEATMLRLARPLLA
ncbi:acetate kinase [Hasllibacter halocynthiae]|uniref:Acetate kinase n=1 Tax=Hasllibacter halocynthiae TaxID=595589 RepID=A0A2T0X2B2_9RHOB|nr:acetate kinase [Hasllibacter halocynthiae]PRY93078.1 acetate kinase [Hasllibacter halocynthiae]